MRERRKNADFGALSTFSFFFCSVGVIETNVVTEKKLKNIKTTRIRFQKPQYIYDAHLVLVTLIDI